jgi:uncharacterized RDD family membrane protein YckC
MQQPPPLPTMNPYAAPAARVMDQLEAGQQELADRGIRLLAAIVDWLITYVWFVMFMLVLVPTVARNSDSAAPALILLFSLGTIILLAVNGVLIHKYGQTIVKRLFKIKIVRSDGSRVSLLRVIFARALPITVLGWIPLIGLLIWLLDALLIFRDDYRCLHDHIADTVVVKA